VEPQLNRLCQPQLAQESKTNFLVTHPSLECLIFLKMGKFLIIAGIALVIAGVLIQFASRIPWLGRLPGDIVIDRGNFRMYIPLTTSILLSVLVSLVIYLINKGK
jgi:hypothetical protein